MANLRSERIVVVRAEQWERGWEGTGAINMRDSKLLGRVGLRRAAQEQWTIVPFTAFLFLATERSKGSSLNTSVVRGGWFLN